MHHCLYKAEGPDKVIDYTLKYTACFGDIFANQSKYDRISIYILKDYKNIGFDHNNRIKVTISTMYRYLVNLKRCGFKFKFIESMVVVKEGERDCYTAIINLRDQSEVANIILINAIRFLYESNYTDLINKFNDLCNEERGPHFLNRFFISQYVRPYDPGHSLHTHDGKLLHLLDHSEIEYLFKNKEFAPHTRNLKRFSLLSTEREIKKTINSKDHQRIFQEYEQLSKLKREEKSIHC